ncbi:MAG: hypothetical protein WCG92_12760 [Hyphomicrobiales bacterium]
MEDLKRIALAEFGKRGNENIEYARMAIELSPVLVEHFYRAHGNAILYERLETAAFISRTTAVRIARLLGSRLRIYSNTPWIDVDIGLLTNFLSDLLDKKRVAAPERHDPMLFREISLMFENLRAASLATRSIGASDGVIIALALALAVLSEMEFAARTKTSRRKEAARDRIQKRKLWIRNIALSSTKKHSKILDDWAQSTE